MASAQNIQLLQGALFLIDNTGPCPTGKKYRNFIDAAIAHHLTRHTYYYQDRGRPGAKNTKRATARKFRNSLQALWEDVKTESRGRKVSDRVEALFTLKSEAIMPRALKMYGYDPATFSETDLPGFVDDGGDKLESREQMQTTSTPAPEAQQAHTPTISPKRKSDFADEPQQHATKRVRTEEPIADTDHQIRPSHMSRSTEELLSVPVMRAEEDSQSSDETQLQAVKRPHTFQGPIADAGRTGFSSRMPRCGPCIQSKKACDRQRPCGRCRAAGIGLEGCIAAEAPGVPGRGELRAVSQNNDATSQSNVETNHSSFRSIQAPLPGPSVGLKRGPESSDESQEQAEKRPRLDHPIEITSSEYSYIVRLRCKRCSRAGMDNCDRQRPCGNCKAAGIDIQGCGGGKKNTERHVGVDPDTRTMSNVTGPRSNHEFQSVTTNRSQGMPRDDADAPGSTDANDARASLGKRKRGIIDTGIETGDGKVQTALVSGQPASPKRQATRSSVKDSSFGGQRRPAALLPESTTSSAPDDKHDNTESNQSDDDFGRMLEQAQKKPDFDLGAFVEQLQDLKRYVEQGALGIISCIGDVHNALCPLDPEPSEQLRTLYVRCFGAEWENDSSKFCKFGGFAMPQNTMSLISAFLYDKIMSQPASRKDLAQDLMAQLQASGSTGRSILQALDWPKRGKSGSDCFR